MLFHCIYGCSDEKDENGDGGGGERMEVAWPLYAEDLVLCGESEEDLRTMVEKCMGKEV